MSYRLHNKTQSLVLAENVENAKSFFPRLKGLLGRNALALQSTLWLEPCDSIHTFFMRFAIDAIFVDDQLVVRRVVRNLKPWRLVPPVAGAQSVFELAAGVASQARVKEGDQLYVGD